MRLKLLLTGIALCAASVLAALLYAPYLPRLAFEGFPQAGWPAPGDFAAVAGSGARAEAIPTDLTGAVFDRQGRSLFEEKEGKALLIYQGGRLRFEHYTEGVDSNSRLNSYSMVKSLIGALVLKAHAEGKIASLQDPVGTYLPQLGDAGFRAIPIADFLAMRSGIAFEPDDVKTVSGHKDIEATRVNPFSPMARLHMLGLDAVAGGLRADPAGIRNFSYQNINTAVLGRLLTVVYGQTLEQILNEKIWAPAGAGTAYWRRYGPGRAVTPYCCLYASPRDWLRVGVYIMSNGSRNLGTEDSGSEKCRFLPPALWRQYLGRDLSYASIKDGAYGSHIYHNVLDRAGEHLQGPFAYMLGNGGQTVYLMPDRDLVVVRFGGQIQLLHSTLYAGWRSIAPRAGTASVVTGGEADDCN